MTLTVPILPPLGDARPAPARRWHETVGANGLRVLAVAQPTVPLVTARLIVPLGLTSDPRAGAVETAAAELMTACLFGGTGSRSEDELAFAVARAGGAWNATVDPERLQLTSTVLTAGLGDAIAALASSLTGATFEARLLDRERARLRDRIRLAGRMQRLLATGALLEHCFPDHPITRQVPGAAEVAVADRDSVLHIFYQVAPRGSVLLIVGDVDPESAALATSAAMQGWTRDGVAVAPGPLPPVVGGAVASMTRAGLRHTSVRLAAPAVGRTDPAYPAQHLANLVLGGYFCSRLNAELRERDGSVYVVQSALQEHTGQPFTAVEFDTAPATAEFAVARTLELLASFATNRPPDPTEIADARHYGTGAFATYLATREGLLTTVDRLDAAGLTPDWLSTHTTDLVALSDADVVAAAAAFHPDAFTGVILTPA